MATFGEYIADIRARAERIGNDPNAPEKAWAWPGEWLDVAEMLAELQQAMQGMTEARQRIVMLAFLAGEAAERARLRAALSPTVDVGIRVKQGGQAGAARAHGPRVQRASKRDRWRTRYAELRQRFPEATKRTLIGMIETETGETFRTLRRYIKQR